MDQPTTPGGETEREMTANDDGGHREENPRKHRFAWFVTPVFSRPRSVLNSLPATNPPPDSQQVLCDPHGVGHFDALNRMSIASMAGEIRQLCWWRRPRALDAKRME